jgi:UDP-N-acetylglucosamine acyltransferase
MGCTVHQYITIGQYSIVATGAAALKNVKPFSRYIPGKPVSVNEYAIRKFGYSEHEDEIRAYVLEGVHPRSEAIGSIVDHFEANLRDGKRETY